MSSKPKPTPEESSEPTIDAEQSSDKVLLFWSKTDPETASYFN